MIDSGSTNSFIDHTVLQKVHIQPIKAYPLIITVANGNKTIRRTEVHQLNWEVQGHTFISDVRVLKLEEYQMVLGVNWLREINPVTFDFRRLTL